MSGALEDIPSSTTKQISKRGSLIQLGKHKKRFTEIFFACLGMIIIVLVSGVIMRHAERDTALKESNDYWKNISNVHLYLKKLKDTLPEEDRENYTILVDMLEYLKGNSEPPEAEEGLNWDFPGAVFFCITIVTTIGYGTFTPVTNTGRIYTAFLSIFGVGYFGVALGLGSTMFTSTVKAFLKKFFATSYETKKAKTVAIATACASILYVMIFAAASLYSIDTYDDGLYFAIVTFTTVGLGDLAPTPQQLKGKSYKKQVGIIALFSVAIFIGLFILVSLIDAVQEYVQARIAIIGAQVAKKTKDLDKKIIQKIALPKRISKDKKRSSKDKSTDDEASQI